MKKIIYLLSVVIFTYACNSEVSVEVTNDNISKIFEKNSETVLTYEKFAEVDYQNSIQKTLL